MVGAFAECSTSRPSGFSAMCIPVPIFRDWCERNGLELDITTHVIRVLRRVDSEILRKAKAEERLAQKPKGKKT